MHLVVLKRFTRDSGNCSGAVTKVQTGNQKTQTQETFQHQPGATGLIKWSGAGNLTVAKEFKPRFASVREVPLRHIQANTPEPLEAN